MSVNNKITPHSSEKRRVLIIINTSFIKSGGLTTVMMNYYRAMDKTGLMIDFASTNDAESSLLSELKGNGSSYYCLGNRKKSLIKYAINLKRLLKRGHYDVLHVNGNSATMLIELMIGKICGVKKRIAHTHTSRSNYPIIDIILRPLFYRFYTDAFCVSNTSGRWLFKSGYQVLHNAIDAEKYKYNEQVRAKIRNTYHIEDKEYVLGTVGKLNAGKNQRFLIDIFVELMNTRNDLRLMICGGGELENSLKEYCKEKQIENKVIFTGMVDGSQEVMQALDCFVFPSEFEGFGMVLVEAQASGLRCYASDTVPKETNVANTVTYISLKKPSKEWADCIDFSVYDRNAASEEALKRIEKSGYSIQSEAYRLRHIYLCD